MEGGGVLLEAADPIKAPRASQMGMQWPCVPSECWGIQYMINGIFTIKNMRWSKMQRVASIAHKSGLGRTKWHLRLKSNEFCYKDYR